MNGEKIEKTGNGTSMTIGTEENIGIIVEMIGIDIETEEMNMMKEENVEMNKMREEFVKMIMKAEENEGKNLKREGNEEIIMKRRGKKSTAIEAL